VEQLGGSLHLLSLHVNHEADHLHHQLCSFTFRFHTAGVQAALSSTSLISSLYTYPYIICDEDLLKSEIRRANPINEIPGTCLDTSCLLWIIVAPNLLRMKKSTRPFISNGSTLALLMVPSATKIDGSSCLWSSSWMLGVEAGPTAALSISGTIFIERLIQVLRSLSGTVG
jgi:hypothetical protein